jgi:poly-gamma-glutamate synthesis protein (capsule biosynthesis protein)
VVSHHPHVLQGIEKYKKGIIFHSIGNLLLDIHSIRRPQAAQTVALKVRLSKSGVNEIVLLPLVLNESFQPEHPRDELTRQIISQLNELSKGLKTQLGIFKSYQYANYIWFHSNLKSLNNMMKRVGVTNTIRYYVSRVLKKLNIKIAMFQ